MPLIQNPVGDKIYVWSKQKGAPSESIAIISAHGGEARMNGMKGIPGNPKLVFYTPHGLSLVDPGLASIIAGNCLSVESMSASESQDYDLGKYQNATENSTRHSKTGESYAALQQFPEAFAQAHTFRGVEPHFAANFLRGMHMDIITIRNRRFSKAPTLSEVLRILCKNKYQYKEIHCSFCRGGNGEHAPTVLSVPDLVMLD